MSGAHTDPSAPPLPRPGAHKGRGTVWMLAHRFSVDQREAFDDGWGTLDQSALEEALPPQTQVLEEQAQSILAANDSPDIGFDLSINPYRGCEHGCIFRAASQSSWLRQLQG